MPPDCRHGDIKIYNNNGPDPFCCSRHSQHSDQSRYRPHEVSTRLRLSKELTAENLSDKCRFRHAMIWICLHL